MDQEPSGQGLRVHRFRKTIARLGALAMTDAPKVLMDVFGHRNIEMTLYYILTDSELQSDIERVTRELTVMRAAGVIEAIVNSEDDSDRSAGFGGPAAPSLKAAIESHRQGLHERGEAWGASTAQELAQILTLNGKAFQVVREGVLCLKFPSEAGPCTKKRGQPDVARCQSHCSNRLEEGIARRDADEIIRNSVENYRLVSASEDDLQKWCWAGQIKAHISRFPDVQAKWSSDPTVQEMLSLGGESHRT